LHLQVQTAMQLEHGWRPEAGPYRRQFHNANMDILCPCLHYGCALCASSRTCTCCCAFATSEGRGAALHLQASCAIACFTRAWCRTLGIETCTCVRHRQCVAAANMLCTPGRRQHAHACLLLGVGTQGEPSAACPGLGGMV